MRKSHKTVTTNSLFPTLSVILHYQMKTFRKHRKFHSFLSSFTVSFRLVPSWETKNWLFVHTILRYSLDHSVFVLQSLEHLAWRDRWTVIEWVSIGKLHTLMVLLKVLLFFVARNNRTLENVLYYIKYTINLLNADIWYIFNSRVLPPGMY